MSLIDQPIPTASTSEFVDASRNPLMLGALLALVFANGMQIAAGLAGIEPSPPADVLPLIAATAALGLAAIPMVRAGERAGYLLGTVFCVASMIGMGPHKLFMEDGGTIAPLALVGFGFELAFIKMAASELKRRIA